MSIFSRKQKPAETVFDAGTQAIADITGDYTIDPSHTSIGFQARHAMVTNVRGSFKEFEGTAHVDANKPSNSSVELTIAVNSVDTGSADRDGHLASADFFDIEKFPTITFKSTKVERDGDDWAVTGDLTIKGVTRTVVFDLDLEVVSAGELRGTASTVVKLTDFDIAVPRVPLVARVDEDVQLVLDFRLVAGQE